MLTVEALGPVVAIRLNRPEVRNALDEDLIDGLVEAIECLPSEIRVVVISGEGKAFCAGGDLAWMKRAAKFDEDANYQDALRLARLFRAILDASAIFVCKAHGAVYGGGCGIVAACDVAIATSETKFSFSEVRLGLIPATISCVVIPKIGNGNARAYFSTGESFSAETALRIGLVQDVVETDVIDAIVSRKVSAILKNGPLAAAQAKRLALDDRLNWDQAAKRLAAIRTGGEASEGIQAFLDKREPSYVVEWKGSI